MKYQAGLEQTKKHLKSIPEPEMREVCEKAGLTPKETEMVVLKYRKGKQRLHASVDLGMSEIRCSVKMTAVLNILKRTLISLGFIDG